MVGREQVTEPLLTGVKALDVMTPVGRGTSMLVIGRKVSGTSTLVEDAGFARVELHRLAEDLGTTLITAVKEG